MDLSPLNKLVGMFDGAESLGGFGPGSYQGAGQRVRGSSRLFAEFYNLTVPEQHTIPEAVKRVQLANGVVRETPTKWKIVPVEKLMIRVVDPGDKYNIFDGIATDEHKREFYPEYEAHMAGRSKPIGTDLSTAPFISEGLKLELNRIKIFTLEQLRDASDSAMALLGVDNFHLRQQSGQWLEASENGAEKKRILDLEKQVAELLARSAPVEVKNKGGRPRKNEETTIST